MIDFGKPEIFEGQMAQAIDGIVWSNVTFADLLEKLANGFGVQEALSVSTRYQNLGIQPTEFLD